MLGFKKIYSKTLKGHSLFIIVVIAFIIGLTCSTLILTAYLKRNIIQQNILEEKLINNSYSGINYLLANPNSAKGEETIDLFGLESDSVALKREYWGVYELLTATAFQTNKSRTQTALAGFKPKGVYASSLYLQDQRRSLSLVGNTQIKGKAYLPEAGVKRAYIQGQGFTGTQLINGAIHRSTDALPNINEEQLDYLFNLFNISSEEVQMIDEELDTLHSFHKPIYVQEITSSDLSQITIKGKVILYSTQKLKIPSNSLLENVIVVAPSISIQSGYKGIIQCFAKDTLMIESNVTLNYPSAAIVLSQEVSLLTLSSNTQVYGHVGIISKENVNDRDKISMIDIQKGAKVYGSVYSSGLLTHHGLIYGHASVNKFFLKTRTSIYENYLLNAVINYSKLSNNHINGSLFVDKSVESSANQNIVKWMQ